jgi:hypothetical protein
MDRSRIEAVLAAYSVRSASARGNRHAPRRYEVWARGRAVSEPMTHPEAKAEMRRLIAAEIVAATVPSEFYDLALAALGQTREMIDKALPEFNWGASALSADGIRLLNETPGVVNAAIASLSEVMNRVDDHAGA